MLPGEHVEPGVVAVSSAPLGGILDVGRYPSGSDAVGHQVAADFEASGFSARSSDTIMRFKYAKLLMNLGNARRGGQRHGGSLLRAL